MLEGLRKWMLLYLAALAILSVFAMVDTNAHSLFFLYNVNMPHCIARLDAALLHHHDSPNTANI